MHAPGAVVAPLGPMHAPGAVVAPWAPCTRRARGQPDPPTSGEGVVDSRIPRFGRWATLPDGAPAAARVGVARPGVRARATTAPGACMGPDRSDHRARRMHGAR